MKSLTSFICITACLISLGCAGDKDNKDNKKDSSEQTSNRPVTTPVTNDRPTDAAAEVTKTATAQEGEWGHLTGKFVLTGDVPERPDENIDKDQAFCLGANPAPKDDKLTVGPEGELRDVFVMMYLKGTDPPAVHPSYEEAKQEPVVIDNINCRFTPHALFVRTGQTLRMKNSDNIGHNCHVNTFNNEKNVNLPAGQHVDWAPENNDTSPGPIVCDVHASWMDATVLVRDEPYVGISSEDGTFTVENIPAGEWKFQFWHKNAGNLRQLQVEGYEVGRRGEIELTIADGETLDLGTMSIAGEELEY